jgi:type VI secretion system protein ImpL
MGNLAAIFKSKNILLALGLLILIFLVIYIGSIIKITWIMRISIIVFILLVTIIIILLKKMKDTQKAGQIEHSISSSSSDSQILSPEKRAEIEQFKKQLEAAISALKNSKLGRGKSGKAALYRLPWYMIIGPSAAGKTTAIQNSGLEFPYGKDSVKGVGGTRNCDWFFSTRAIFLDTAGRYVSESEDRPEWVAFLETLKKNRKKKPVNGVVVALNIDEIIKSDNNQLYDHAKNIRSRVDELITNLGVVFPVYFVFTKCDLIQGFVEYFGDFSEIERSQIWGATLNPQPNVDQNPKTAFENEFNKLADVIYKARTIRLSNPLKREQRRKVFLFPYQFNSLKEKLIYLIGEVFQQNPYQDNPIFRGFYFTSGTQEGAPLDMAIRKIAQQFNLPPAPGEQFEEIVETKNYFIKDLLNDVVIGDQNYVVGQTAAIVKQDSLKRYIAIGASAALLLFMGLFFVFARGGSAEALDKIEANAGSFSQLNWNGDLLKNFSHADSLREIVVKIELDEFNESFFEFGLDRSQGTLEKLTQLYFKKTNPFFTQYVYNEIVNTLTNYSNGQEYSGEVIYNSLKAYLLLGDERSKLDTINQKFLVNIFSGTLQSKFVNSNSIASTTEKDSLSKLFRNYITFFVQKLAVGGIYSIRNDNTLLSSVRYKFQNKPSAESIYARMKEDGRNQYPAELTLTQLIQGKSGQVVQTDTRIPYIFTLDGWRNYFDQAILEESKNPGKEDWVTGKSQSQQSYNYAYDSETIKNQLTDLYIKDFTQTWVQFLQSIRYSGFESIPFAANNLKLLSDPGNSPLVLILKVFADQSKVIANIKTSVDTTNPYSAYFSTASNSDIKRLRKFVVGPEDGSAPPDLNIVLMQYGMVNGILEGLKGNPDLAKEYAVKVMNQQAVDFQASVKAIQGAIYNVPELQTLITEPLNSTWKSTLTNATSSISAQWKAKVVDVFNRTLAKSFPFNDKGPDAPLQDFDEFFNPQTGVLWTFYNAELSSFIKKDDWKVNQQDGSGPNLSSELINALKKADEITSVLYKGGALNLSFKLKPQLPVSKAISERKATVIQYYLNIDGVIDAYKMGAPYETVFNWPNNSTSGTALYITLNEFGTSDKISYNGDWSFFRLLNDASISRGVASSQLILNWNFAKQNMYDVSVSYVLNAGSSRHPFSQNFFKSFKLPNSLN